MIVLPPPIASSACLPFVCLQRGLAGGACRYFVEATEVPPEIRDRRPVGASYCASATGLLYGSVDIPTCTNALAIREYLASLGIRPPF